jgi:hypothetical protein
MLQVKKRVVKSLSTARWNVIRGKVAGFYKRAAALRDSFSAGIATKRARAYCAARMWTTPKIIKGAVLLSTVGALHYALSGSKPITKNKDTAEMIAPVINTVPAGEPVAPGIVTQIATVKEMLVNLTKSPDLSDADRKAIGTYPAMLDKVAAVMQQLSAPLTLDDRNSVGTFTASIRTNENTLTRAYELLDALQKFLVNRNQQAEAAKIEELIDSMSVFLLLVGDARGAMQ